MTAWDQQLFYRINGLAGQNQLLDWLGIFASQWLIWLMVLALAVLSIQPLWRRRKGLCLVCHALPKSIGRRLAPGLATAFAASAALLAAVLAWLGNQLFSWLIVWRQRPFAVLKDVNQLVSEPLTGKSFPSDHSAVAFALAVSLILVRPRLGLVFLLAAGLVAWGRVFVGVHFPSDVLAGALIGGLWALAARWLERRVKLTKRLCRGYERACHRLSGK